MLLFLGIGTSEFILIALAALLLFGAKGLPKFARSAGKFAADFNSAMQDVKNGLSANENKDISPDCRQNKKDEPAAGENITEEPFENPYNYEDSTDDRELG